MDSFVNDMHGLAEPNLKARAVTIAHARDNQGRETHANCNDARVTFGCAMHGGACNSANNGSVGSSGDGGRNGGGTGNGTGSGTGGGGGRVKRDHCGKRGHAESDCWRKHPDRKPARAAQPAAGGCRNANCANKAPHDWKTCPEVKCHGCGDEGHIKPNCSVHSAALEAQANALECALKDVHVATGEGKHAHVATKGDDVGGDSAGQVHFGLRAANGHNCCVERILPMTTPTSPKFQIRSDSIGTSSGGRWPAPGWCGAGSMTATAPVSQRLLPCGHRG